MQEGKGYINEVAERAGVVVGMVLRIGLELVSGFGDGLRQGMKGCEEGEAPKEASEETPREEESSG